MNIHRVSENIGVKTMFNAILAASTQNGPAIDCLGFRRAAVSISGWTGAATTLNWQLQESADGSTNWLNITQGTLATPIAAGQADGGVYLYDIDLAKRLRYLRLNVVGTGAAGNATALLFLVNPWNAPPPQDRVAVNIVN